MYIYIRILNDVEKFYLQVLVVNISHGSKANAVRILILKFCLWLIKCESRLYLPKPQECCKHATMITFMSNGSNFTNFWLYK